MKLKNLQAQQKDFVLIFKNKSNKEYKARKKVDYSAILRHMKMKGELKNKMFNN